MRTHWLWMAVVMLWLPTVAQAETVAFTECHKISFVVDDPCAAPEASPVMLSPAPPPVLFPPGTVSPYASPAMLTLANDPTLENARRLQKWRKQRWARLQEVEALLKQVEMEEPSGAR